ncbi:MAG: nucleoid-associated protein [Clostridia bacterium]|nr:nucleoid-associated protein [Clostridia bacterium]
MSEEINITIKNLIVHILDNNLHMPVISDQEHPEDEEIDEFVKKHILKILKDENLKTARFIGENNKMRELSESIAMNNSQFKPVTDEIAVELFGIMQKHVDIPSADLLCTFFELDAAPHLAVLKFNYKPSYIHYVQTLQAGRVNSIVKQKTSLPTEGQKVEECAIINLFSLDIKLIEKKYEINGEKEFYFSTLFLNCTSDLSSKEKVKLFKKATESFNKQYFEEDFSKTIEIRQAVTESLDQNAVVDVVEVAENVFRQNPELKQTYVEYVEKAGLRDKTFEVSESVADKSFRRQRIKTDTGIEINLPIEYYKDNDKLEFINNVDGTISIVIKNVARIMDA